MTRVIGTGLFVVVLVSFLMPWISVEYSGIKVQATGLDMAIGRDVDTSGLDSTSNVLPGQDPQTFGLETLGRNLDPSQNVQQMGIEPLAAAALLLGIVGVALFFARSRGGNIGRISVGVLGVVALIALKLKIENDLVQLGPTGAIFSLNWEFGFWLALLAFALAAGVQVLEMVAGDRLPSIGIPGRDLPSSYPGDPTVDVPVNPAGGEMSTRSLYHEASSTQQIPRPGSYGDAMTIRSSYEGRQVRVCNGSQAGQSFNLVGNMITIGRSTDNDVVLNDPTVSRHHARMYHEGPDLFLEDLGSTSGTMLNGVHVNGPQRLTPGSTIKFGNAEVSYEGPDGSRTAATQLARPTSGGNSTLILGKSKGTAWLLVQKGSDQAGQSFVLQGDNNTVGRSAVCAIRLADPAVSREHALIRKVGGRYVLFDMGSEGGIRVDGQTTGLGGAPIHEGSRLLLGICELRFSMVQGGPPQASPGGTLLLRQERRGALLVGSGPASGQSIPLSDDVVIGREPGPGEQPSMTHQLAGGTL